MSAKRQKEVESTPAELKSGAFDMMRDGGLQPGYKVVKEDKTATGATLQLEGVDKGKNKRHDRKNGPRSQRLEDRTTKKADHLK